VGQGVTLWLASMPSMIQQKTDLGTLNGKGKTIEELFFNLVSVEVIQ
jgi:hypothetical protein